MTPVCANCRFWVRQPYPPLGHPTCGDCRLKGPKLLQGKGDYDIPDRWPQTLENEWCGEYQPKPPVGGT